MKRIRMCILTDEPQNGETFKTIYNETELKKHRALPITMGSISNLNIYYIMKKSIYQYIADTYKDTMPTLEQVTSVIKEYAPNISSPSLTFEELVTNIYDNYKRFYDTTKI